MKIYTGKPVRRQSRRIKIRIFACFLSLAALFCLTGVRLCFLSLNTETADAAGVNSTSRLEIYPPRCGIYDRNFHPLTTGESIYYTCVSPTPQAYTALSSLLGGASLNSALEKIKENKPFLIKSSDEITGTGLTVIKTDKRYGLSPHILGYTGSDGHGISGIEKDFDSLLYTGEKCTVRYTADAAGGMLPGISPKVEYPQISGDGVVLTLDRDIQTVCEEATGKLTAGAAVVTDIATGDILAMVSRPGFESDNIESALNDPAHPLINRALTNYNVGSVFKPLIAAAALESGLEDDFTVNCTGSLNIGGRIFGCHKKNGHGEMDLHSAIANSCNVFFYSLSSRLSAEKCILICDKLNFFAPVQLSNSIVIPAAGFPKMQDLSSPAAMANLSIGQGDLMLSPAALAGLYGAVARGGEYIKPRLIKGIFKEGYTEFPAEQPVKVFSKDTADKISSALKSVIDGGTGVAASPESISAAGKTATAETGWIIDERPVNQSWFAGFFPAENPKYCAVILNENGSSGSYDCAPIFKTIADGIIAVKGK